MLRIVAGTLLTTTLFAQAPARKSSEPVDSEAVQALEFLLASDPTSVGAPLEAHTDPAAEQMFFVRNEQDQRSCRLYLAFNTPSLNHDH